MTTLAQWPDELVYSRSGDPRANGPRCASCGALAAFDSHPMCEREDGSLVVMSSAPPPTLLDELRDAHADVEDQPQRIARRDDLLMKCLMHGYTQADLARVTGLSTARINQLVKPRAGHVPAL